jgi:hypothetical protein
MLIYGLPVVYIINILILITYFCLSKLLIGMAGMLHQLEISAECI